MNTTVKLNQPSDRRPSGEFGVYSAGGHIFFMQAFLMLGNQQQDAAKQEQRRQELARLVAQEQAQLQREIAEMAARAAKGNLIGDFYNVEGQRLTVPADVAGLLGSLNVQLLGNGSRDDVAALAVVRAALADVGQREQGENRGEIIRRMTGGMEGVPWCQAAVTYWLGQGLRGASNGAAGNPFRQTISTADFHAQLRERNLGLHDPTSAAGQAAILAGNVIIRPRTERMGHVGIILGRTANGQIAVVEGNTRGHGTNGGEGVAIRVYTPEQLRAEGYQIGETRGVLGQQLEMAARQAPAPTMTAAAATLAPAQ